MNVSSITKATSKVAQRGLLQLRKYAPDILIATGIVGVVAGGVLAAKATLKLEDVVDEAQEQIQEAKDRYENQDGVETEEERDRAVRKAYFHGTIAIVKLYGPSVALGTAGLVAIVSSHAILKTRNAGLLAAYNALAATYSAYRARVVEAYGEDKDRDFHLGLKNEKIVNEETGKTEKIKLAGDPNEYSQYARIFDESNPNWTKQADQNLFFLRANQNYLNDILLARGHVFLNEMYDALGFERTQAGAVVGWLVDREGDNFVDFGIYEVRNSNFVNGYERSIIIDPNVNGVIFDKI